MGTNDASGTGPAPGSSGFWSPPCPSILALGAWVGKGTSFAYSPGMMHQNRNPHQRASLVLPWCFPLLSLPSYLPPGEKCRDVGAREAWVHIPARLSQAVAAAARRGFSSLASAFPHPDWDVSCGVAGRVKLEKWAEVSNKAIFSLSLPLALFLFSCPYIYLR